VGKPSLYAAQPYAKAEGRVFLLVPAYPGCPGTKAVKRLLLLVHVASSLVWQLTGQRLALSEGILLLVVCRSVSQGLQ